MSLEHILQALEAETERQITQLEQATQAEIEQIQAQTQAEAAALQQKQLQTIQPALQAEQARLLNQARVQAMQTVTAAREAAITTLIEATRQRLMTLSATPTYPALLRCLTKEAAVPLAGQNNICLHVKSDDQELMRQLIQELELNATIVAGLPDGYNGANPSATCPSLGGLVASTSDGRIRLDNTLATRLQRATLLYRSQFAELLFSPPQEG